MYANYYYKYYIVCILLQVLDLDSITTHHWLILGCSAVTGDNLLQGVDWTINDIASRIFTADWCSVSYFQIRFTVFCRYQLQAAINWLFIAFFENRRDFGVLDPWGYWVICYSCLGSLTKPQHSNVNYFFSHSLYQFCT